ncbi:Integrin alpha-6 [Thelohanellus kitauei]|uniref:Integrin alpha-6 n=1 Tax=Thelohanellus kitauei TaxID=669202 RepID=A0A0C2IZV8_THEKT|nr:Integrin alpha-6 [Thelohanellus kitauei]
MTMTSKEECEETIPDLKVSNPEWQPFTNFANKIIIVDINKDGYNDLIVTSPTSKWLDLPEVGHVHLFINTKSQPFFDSKSTIIRGLPIAHSFFGWNAEVVGDLDGDGVNDFLVAALRVSESDSRGGVYVFLGGDNRVLRELTYYEIIQPTHTIGNELTGFGFFLSQKMVLDQSLNNYILMSRVFSGEVDVFRITPRAPIKIIAYIEPDRLVIDEEKNAQDFSLQIRYTNIEGSVYQEIKLSVIRSSNYLSFNGEYPLDTFVEEKALEGSFTHRYIVHLLPTYENIPSKLAIQAEITLVSKNEATNRPENEILFNQIFYHEVLYYKECTQKDCISDYDVTPRNKPVWYQNSDQPIIFNLLIKNNGYFLTHLIIDAGLSVACKITISNTEIVPVMDSKPIWLFRTKSNVRVLYKKITSSHGSFELSVQVQCGQVLDDRRDLTLRLLIKPVYQDNLKRFEFKATTKLAAEFTIENKRSPVITKHLCRDSEFREILEFKVELSFGGVSYDNDSLLSAVLFWDGSLNPVVDSILIESSDCSVVVEENLLRHPPNSVTQKFRILKDENIRTIRLSVSYMIRLRYSKDFHMTLKIEPVVGADIPYELKSIVTNETKYHAIISFKLCKNEWLMLVFSALGCCIVVICFCFLIYYIFPSRVVHPNRYVTYIVENSDRLDAY